MKKTTKENLEARLEVVKQKRHNLKGQLAGLLKAIEHHDSEIKQYEALIRAVNA